MTDSEKEQLLAQTTSLLDQRWREFEVEYDAVVKITELYSNPDVSEILKFAFNQNSLGDRITQDVVNGIILKCLVLVGTQLKVNQLEREKQTNEEEDN